LAAEWSGIAAISAGCREVPAHDFVDSLFPSSTNNQDHSIVIQRSVGADDFTTSYALLIQRQLLPAVFEQMVGWAADFGRDLILKMKSVYCVVS